MAKEKVAENKKKAKAEKSKQPAKKKVQDKNRFSLTNYLKDVRQELKRVSWPTRKEVYQSTLLVLFVVGFFVIYVGVVDQILIQVIKVLTATLTGGQ